ncbi:MAG TPA: hypothetical protein VG326_17460 [Tepidisphaeraceae bacterium]|nr:hypothetical protein [Tepidisphaeraceae bacterium]
MSAIGANAFAAFAARRASFVGGELVSRPFFMSGLAPFAGDFSLLIPIH